ncbi:MAG: formylglycine-generating enzyme family protein [Candidatus Sumerlaeota bacterium]|nr:formylglycine-generating enzyme family protein [Candidatus Sumerlaeota bacterium]
MMRIAVRVSWIAGAALALAFMIADCSQSQGGAKQGAVSALAKGGVTTSIEQNVAAMNTFVETAGGFDMKMIWISGGTFEMGSRESASELGKIFGSKYESVFEGEKPSHPVTLDGFWMSEAKVTVGQFRCFINDTGYKTEAEKEGKAFGIKDGKFVEQEGFSWRNLGFIQTDTHPVVNVSWNDAKAFCDWMSGKTGKAYQLPTEAQWEYACRAGTKTLYPWGGDEDGGKGRCNAADQSVSRQFPDRNGFSWDDSYVFTSPVKNFKPNAWGLYDMPGNASEWCADWYGYYDSGRQRNPTGPVSGEYRVVRGGSWFTLAVGCRSAARSWTRPFARQDRIGFRVCLVARSK